MEWTSNLAAAIGEELAFRGYIIERVEDLTNSTAVAIIASSLLFAVWHLPLWGPGETIFAGAWGILFALFYVSRRDLIACMFTHLLVDATESKDIGFSAGPYPWGYWAFSIYFRVRGH